MVVVLKTDSGTQILSANLLKTIQSIREIVGNHSDSDIYNALKECNMDPNETAQKLLHQDPFHEVRRRRDKKKENAVQNSYAEPRKRSEYTSQGAKIFNPDRNARGGGYTRSAVYDAGISREFRVVRDNRVNQNSDRESKGLPQVASSGIVQHSNVSDRSIPASSNHQKHFGGRSDFRPKPVRDFNYNARREHLGERRPVATSSRSQFSNMKSAASLNHGSSNIGGVCASTSDPVHVPSPDSRSASAIGAIRREVGVVGSRRQSSEITLNSTVGSLSSKETSRAMGIQSDQARASVVESATISSASSRVGNHFGNRLHQQTVGHQKGLLPSKEWKPKTSQKPVPNPGVIGSPVKSVSKTADGSKDIDKEVDNLENKFSQVNIHESQNVIIAQHIRIPENDRLKLTFGSFGVESDGTESLGSAIQVTETAEEAAPEPSTSDKQINSVDDQAPRSGSGSPPSNEAAEDQSPQKRDSSGVPSAQDYSGGALVHNGPSFPASESQQNQDHTDLPNFSAYTPQPVYDIPYFRPSVDEAVDGQGLPSPQEQQAAPMAQMYPQVHVSHFTNMMPYRQYLSPLYVPPMVPAGYSGNPAAGYPHLPPNGSNYVLMPSGAGGGGSHLTGASNINLKYGVQQFKPAVQGGGSPTGFCNFAANPPTAYAINAPPAGVVGGPVGLDDSSRIKYKDANLYAPNPPAETSEVWIQNQREMAAGIQSTPYFNMNMQSHPGGHHASFNPPALLQQSSHMQMQQFPPGMYPQQPNVMPTAHHHHHHHNMGPIGVGPVTAPGTQVGGAFQQPQISHLNWTPNY